MEFSLNQAQSSVYPYKEKAKDTQEKKRKRKIGAKIIFLLHTRRPEVVCLIQTCVPRESDP